MTLSLLPKQKVFLIKTVIHLFALGFLSHRYSLAFSDQLGADPVKAIIHFTGIGAFNLLLITLLITPLAKTFRLNYLINCRRLLGIYTFVYAFLHLINFLAFEVQFNWVLFLEEIVKRPYITLGLTAFILLLALAITSLNSLKQKLGKNWQYLHNFIYLIGALVAVHFYWSVKSEIIEPSIYMLFVMVLIAFRAKKIASWFKK